MEAVKAGASKETTLKVSDEAQLVYGEFGDYRISQDCMRLEAYFIHHL